MAEVNFDTDSLREEIASLRLENANLEAQLAYYRQLFRQFKKVLGMAESINDNLDNNATMKVLLRENERLRTQLQIQRLTNREREVLKYLANGYTSKEIGQQLDISKLTVDTYRKHIQKKLEAANVVDLVRMVVDSGLL